MSKIHRPRRGSLAFSPRKRAKREVPRIRAWAVQEETKLIGFAGYKAGMTHVIMTDNSPHSITSEMQISVPVTVVETPPIKIAAIRVYEQSYDGAKAIAEAWAQELDENLSRSITIPKRHDTTKALEKIEQLIKENVAKELRVITYTQPEKVTGIPKKKPDIMENGIGGKDLMAKFEYAKTILGKSISISEVFSTGDFVDVIAVTKGKGTQGPVKRWGIQLQKGKHSRAGSEREVGTLGPWRPAHVSWRVPQMGQTGYHQRTEFNKRILHMGTNGEEVTPKGGFLHYGIVRNDYVLIKGSIPGPAKRLVRLRPAIRAKKQLPAPKITYISLESKQG